MRITRTRTIDAPADAVWEVIGPQFADVGVWASEVEDSAGAHADGHAAVAGAPCDGRVCSVATPGFEQVREDLVAYDDATRSLTYRAAAGMPGFATEVRNTWAVRDLGGGRSEASMSAEVGVLPVARRALPVLAVLLGRLGHHTLVDLDHYVRTGRPSPRKVRRSASAPAARRVLRLNAGFSLATGAALAVGAPRWAPAFGDVDAGVLVGLGTGLALFGAAVTAVSRAPSRRVVAGLAALDLAWVAGSAGLLVLAGRHLTAGAWAAVLGTSAVVGVLGWAEHRLARAPHEPVVRVPRTRAVR